MPSNILCIHTVILSQTTMNILNKISILFHSSYPSFTINTVQASFCPTSPLLKRSILEMITASEIIHWFSSASVRSTVNVNVRLSNFTFSQMCGWMLIPGDRAVETLQPKMPPFKFDWHDSQWIQRTKVPWMSRLWSGIHKPFSSLAGRVRNTSAITGFELLVLIGFLN